MLFSIIVYPRADGSGAVVVLPAVPLGLTTPNTPPAITAGTARKWALELDPAFLSVINKLGRGSLHANAGDITLQDQLDSDLLYLVRETFDEPLDIVYEREELRRGRLKALETKAEAFRGKHPDVAAEPRQEPTETDTAAS